MHCFHVLTFFPQSFHLGSSSRRLLRVFLKGTAAISSNSFLKLESGMQSLVQIVELVLFCFILDSLRVLLGHANSFIELQIISMIFLSTGPFFRQS